MANAHYSADSASQSRLRLHPSSPKSGNQIPVEITGVPILARELTAPAVIPVYMLADDASIYVGHTGCHRRLAEHTALPTTPSPTGTSPTKTTLD